MKHVLLILEEKQAGYFRNKPKCLIQGASVFTI